MSESLVGSVKIRQGRTSRDRYIGSTSPFFRQSQDYVINVTEEKIIIKIPDIDHQGRTYKGSNKTKNYTQLYVCHELPIGNFSFDKEESTSDMVVIYLNENL